MQSSVADVSSILKNKSNFTLFSIKYIYTHFDFNPFMPNKFSRPYQLDESISNFRVVGWYFHFYSNFKRNFCKQTVENLIRRHVLRCLIWFCTVCRCPTKKDARLIWVIISKLNITVSSQHLPLHILEDFENASPYFCTFLANRICD